MHLALRILVAAVLPFTLAVPAHAQPVPEARDIGDACPSEDLSDLPFEDLDEYWNEPDQVAVLCIWQRGITTGMTPTTYGPRSWLSRGQLATFMARTLREAGAELPEGSDAFPDDERSPYEDDINALAAAGIVEGFEDGTYDPTAAVLRGHMAAYLVRAYRYLSGTAPEATADYFPDDETHPLEAAINAAAEAGWTDGFIMDDGQTRLYMPCTPVIRAQMAWYLARWLDLAVEEGFATPAVR